jgi:hypothetical protein
MTMSLDGIVDRSCAPEHVRARMRARPARALTPQRRSLVILYSTFVACALLAPRPILERLRSAEPGPAVTFATKAMEHAEAISRSIGAQPAFDGARDRFLNGPFPPTEDYRLRSAYDQ